MQIDTKYQPLLLEALEELMYKLSLELETMKGQPMTESRKRLSEKQEAIEQLQHLISTSS